MSTDLFDNMSIAARIQALRSKLPESVTLVAVSKTKSVSEIMEAYTAGQRDFGENKIQELHTKQAELPADIRWHMVGHVQRNKVKYIAPYIHLIHGVDSYKLLREINKQGAKNNRVIPCLLQVHIALESTKFGMDEEELTAVLHSLKEDPLPYVNITGLMGMATFTTDIVRIKKEFEYLSKLRTALQAEFPELKELSMGMSGDYPLAVDLGSTMVRIGSSIFGARK